MLDAPGPWGTGPFMLKDGYSSIYNMSAMIKTDPFASTWITTLEERTPFVTLEANPYYWNQERGPRLNQVVFRNDLTVDKALQLCLYQEGHVDILTGVSPIHGQEVVASPYAKLVPVNSQRVLTGVFNRFERDVSFDDIRLRLAMNLAIDRADLIQKGFLGYATAVPALTPPWSPDFPEGLSVIQQNASRARQLLNEAGWPNGRPLRLATVVEYNKAAQVIGQQVEQVLGIEVVIEVIPPLYRARWMRMLAEKKLIPPWDILLVDTLAFFSEATPAFFHREFYGRDGALRAGPVLPEFERLFSLMASQLDWQELLKMAKQIDRYAYKEALSLFLCCPQELYAVNRHVQFRPYRTTFELADTEVTPQHWSRRLF